MPARIFLTILLLWCGLAFGQADANGPGSDTTPADDSQMRVPPPVSNQAYATEVGDSGEANYWRGGFTFSSGYSSNITGGTRPVGDVNYSFWPSISLDKVTTRLHLLVSYSPGFTLYQRTSSYNQVNQNLNVGLQYRLSPNLTLSLQEGFQKSSNLFDQPNPVSALSVSGSIPSSGAVVVAPLASQINNATSAQLRYQVSESGMIGFGGSFGKLSYTNPEQASGLYNSRSEGASAFYSRRLGEKYYIGANFQYEQIVSYQANAPNTQTEIATVFGFLSVYLNPRLSVSISGGPQHYAATQSSFPPSAAWSPMLLASVGWKGERLGFAGSFSRTVSGGGGLSGAYHSSAAAVSANWRLSRNWSGGVGASYSDNQTLTPLFLNSFSGRTVIGTVSAQRGLGEHTNVQFGYNWTNQNYNQSAALASIPNINRIFVSINYQFTRPVQR